MANIKIKGAAVPATLLQLIEEIQETMIEVGGSWGDFRVRGSHFDHFGHEFVSTHGLQKHQADNILNLAAESNGVMLPRLLAAHGIC